MPQNFITHSSIPDINCFPLTWASDWGEDNYGLWMAFTFKKIRYALRWIKPGRFMMGSPEDELERYKDESQHEVILTQGFWLGETTCAQELWKAVMGKNPSFIKGTQKPVGNVSWDDCMAFIKEINQRMPGLNLRLPTEAEWEYACRAGTQTPFSFGDNNNADLVNSSDDHLHVVESKGKVWGEPVEVGSLPCNQWGLYEMHGNVYEWCSDWYGEYQAETIINPVGPENGEERLLRGGCWVSPGRHLRSAARATSAPRSLYDTTGFRLARGHQEGQGLAEPTKENGE